MVEKILDTPLDPVLSFAGATLAAVCTFGMKMPIENLGETLTYLLHTSGGAVVGLMTKHVAIRAFRQYKKWRKK